METLLNFIHMNGYGVYVWSAYGITLFGLLSHYYLERKQFKKACDAVSALSANDIDPRTRTIIFRKII